MADFIKIFFIDSMPITVWLLVHMRFGVNFGSSNKCQSDQGYMNASDVNMLPGSNLTLYCWLDSSIMCNELVLDLDMPISEKYKRLNSSNSHLVSTHVLLRMLGMQTFTCRCRSGSMLFLICGIYVFVGIPPERPKNVSCHQYGKNGSVTCSWDEGRYTNLSTEYTLQLTNGTFWEEIKSSENSVKLKVKLDFGSTYTVVVIATNELGNASSQPIQFALIDIAKPYSPVNVSVKFNDFTATNCTIFWEDQQETPHFRLRYQPVHINSWSMLENINTRRYDLHNLKPDTEYKFQVSSRFLSNKGLWSEWSMPFQTEAVPSEPTDVWYIWKDASPHMQNITLFWKARNLLQKNQKSHHYKVTFQHLNQIHQRATEIKTTSFTVSSRLTPRIDYNITICSYNSRGISLPVYITTKLEITDLPPPTHVCTALKDNGSIIVAWEAPLVSSLFINGYVVEWADHHHGNSLKSHSSWLKVPAYNFSIVVENLKPDMCYQIGVYALYWSRAGKAASTAGNISAKAPLAGPHINTTVKDGMILVSWREIPSDQQMGCIVNYTIHVQKQPGTSFPETYDVMTTVPQPFPIKNIQAGVVYAVWMTASTVAGEGPKGNEERLYIKNLIATTDGPDWHPILFICIMAPLVCVCCVPSARRKLLSFFGGHLCGWYSKSIPDPANSLWAKEVKSKEDESILCPTPFLENPNTFEEPETLQIEEVFIKRQYQCLKDNSYSENMVKRENHNFLTVTILSEEDPSAKNLDCNPLSTKRGDNSGGQESPPLYRKVVPTELNQGQMFSEYLSNQLEDATINYLPNTVPTTLNSDENSNDSDFNTLFVFPRTFMSQTFSFDGKLTLDAVKMDQVLFKD